MSGVRLYARSRGLRLTLVSLAGTAAFALWTSFTGDGAPPEPGWASPVVALLPSLAAVAIGASLHAPSDELDRTAVRAWWSRRLVHLLALTVVAGVLLLITVRGDGLGFGPAAVIRNLLGGVGLTAAGAALLGARLSWLPASCHVGVAFLAADSAHGRAVAAWAWPTPPGQSAAAWWAAGTAFVLGAGLYAVRGARPEGPSA
ncbi:hypothetical protein PV723_35100 [Streptomyces sp. AK04-3B]|nr:hypothetical protein [Streptomyces sp. AK04-3B]